jgi:hypothetical protein
LFQDHRIEPAVLYQPSVPQPPPADFDHHVVAFPTRYAPYVPAELVARRSPEGLQPPVRKHEIRQIAVLEIASLRNEFADDLDKAIELALGEAPRGLVCDLTASLENADHGAMRALAAAGRHVRDWPGIPVVVACPDLAVREKLASQPLGQHLVMAESMFCALSSVLSTPTLAVERLRLAPHPSAPRMSREFVTRTLLDWRLGRVIPFATLVVSELVASSSIHTGSDIELSVVWDGEALRLTVQDHGQTMAGQTITRDALQRRGLTVVAGLSRAFGVLPTADGGKVVWAVLKAPSVAHRPSTRRAYPTPARDRRGGSPRP